jgi:transposase
MSLDEYAELVESQQRKPRAQEVELERKSDMIKALQQRLFGSKSERLDPLQDQLDFTEEVLGKMEPAGTDATSGPGEGGAASGERSPKSRRKKSELLPRNLPVVVVEVVVPDEVLADPDGYVEIGEEHHDEVSVTRARLFLERRTRKKFKAKSDRSRPPIVAPAPEPSIPGTMCSPELMAMLIVDKHGDHLPHYRQSRRFLRSFDAVLHRQKINRWVHAAAAHLKPVCDAIRSELLAAKILQIDETPMSYLSPGLGKAARGYMWMCRDPVAKNVYCEWHLGRGHECLLKVLGIDPGCGAHGSGGPSSATATARTPRWPTAMAAWPSARASPTSRNSTASRNTCAPATPRKTAAGWRAGRGAAPPWTGSTRRSSRRGTNTFRRAPLGKP